MSNPQATTPSVRLKQKLEGAHELRELIRAHRAHSDKARQLAQPVVEALARLGVFRALVPASAGGEEWEWPTRMRIVEELSTVDGAVGWNAGVGSTTNAVVSGWVSTEVGRSVFCQDSIGLVAGSGSPPRTGHPVNGGYRVSGRWPFGSGSPHASWFLAGCVIEGELQRGNLMMLVPATDVEIIDTWFVGGLRGTGSQDYAVHDLFVPTAYTFNAFDDPPLHPGPLYRLPFVLTVCSALGPLALGIARGAVDSFTQLMATKIDGFAGTPMRERPTVQERLAKAEAVVRSARAFFYEMVHEVWDTVEQGAELTERQLALFSLANMHAVAAGAQAVDLVYHAAGTSAIFTTNLLERFFRDIHVATQHRCASPEELYQAGRVLLGLPLSGVMALGQARKAG